MRVLMCLLVHTLLRDCKKFAPSPHSQVSSFLHVCITCMPIVKNKHTQEFAFEKEQQALAAYLKLTSMVCVNIHIYIYMI